MTLTERSLATSSRSPYCAVTDEGVETVKREDGYREPRAHGLRTQFQALWPDEGRFPVPVDAIAEDLLGLRVEEVPLPGKSGLLYPGERRVLLNAPPVRRRFTLAHELGHWVCQCISGSTRPLYCRAEEVVESERARKRKANVFAAELLMPEEAIRATAGNIFGVSDLAHRWRLYSFGLAECPPV
jgi:hypothetical protein